ncbi:uncharacterized protein [Typha angustifolia]|uniref:uncharacterized protein isoform X1 n=2 Tax=Typha angustifolia TaxID=59011 RepID=UPI003C2BEFC7
MGDVLGELEEILRSKPNKDKITSGEEMILQSCKAKAIRDFTVVACASSAIVWSATRRLTHAQRFNFAVGSAMIGGMWKFGNSLDACVDQILGIEGSRMQRELANLILTKHSNNKSKVQLVSKHFYPEQVFSDLNPDKPFLRWRSRHLYIDNASLQRTEDIEHGGYHDKPDIQPKQTARAPVGDMVADPLDCIFGLPESSKEINQSNHTGTVPKRRLRANKRAHQRHRGRHAENAEDMTNYQAHSII